MLTPETFDFHGMGMVFMGMEWVLDGALWNQERKGVVDVLSCQSGTWKG